LALKQRYEFSVVDGLTGAINRKHFDNRLIIELAYAKRHQTEMSLLLLDIDHFKEINDRLGHQAGDAVLRQLAAAIKATLRLEDVFARYGARSSRSSRGASEAPTPSRSPIEFGASSKTRGSSRVGACLGDSQRRSGHARRLQRNRASTSSWVSPTPRSTRPRPWAATAAAARCRTRTISSRPVHVPVPVPVPLRRDRTPLRCR